jgi:hypothetical protein
MVMELKHEMNQVLLRVKIGTRELEEATTRHQSVLNNYKDYMQKYDHKMADWVKKTIDAQQFWKKIQHIMVTFDFFNPKVAKIERDIQNIQVRWAKIDEENEKSKEYDQDETDIFLSTQPIYSPINKNIISFYKSINFAIRGWSDSDRLDELKNILKQKIEKFKALPLISDTSEMKELEEDQRQSVFEKFNELLEIQVSCFMTIGAIDQIYAQANWSFCKIKMEENY